MGRGWSGASGGVEETHGAQGVVDPLHQGPSHLQQPLVPDQRPLLVVLPAPDVVQLAALSADLDGVNRIHAAMLTLAN